MAEGIKISEMEVVAKLSPNAYIPIVENGENKKISLMNALYPVGCKIISTENPSTWLSGTTWTNQRQYGFYDNIVTLTDNLTPDSNVVVIDRNSRYEIERMRSVFEWTRTA